MRIKKTELLSQMGIDEDLEPFETIPVDYFDSERGVDFCSSISMSGDGNEIEAEIQMIEHLDEEKLRFRQVFALYAKRERPREEMFIVELMRIREQIVSGQKMNWLKNGCRFFKMCLSHIKKGMIPDFDVLYKASFGEEQSGKGEFWSGGRGSRNLKNDKQPPKMKPPGRL